MISSKETINTSVKDSTGADLALNGETLVTMYVLNKSGSHHRSRMTLQYSPDNGKTWFDDPHTTNGIGYMTTEIVATNVRAKVDAEEDTESTAQVFILAR